MAQPVLCLAIPLPFLSEILLSGLDIKAYDLNSLRQAIGVIFQDYVTYFFSAAENVGVGRLADIEERALIEAAEKSRGKSPLIKQQGNCLPGNAQQIDEFGLPCRVCSHLERMPVSLSVPVPLPGSTFKLERRKC